MRPSVRTSVGTVLAALILAAIAAGPDQHRATAAEVRYEAEQATIINGVVENDYSGFTGTGYVDSANAVGAAIEFSVRAPAAGSRALVFRYANGSFSGRPATVTVNGTVRGTLQFPGTGGWTTWRTQTLTTALSAGANVVRLTATTRRGLANIDSLSYDDGLPSSPSPTASPTASVPPGTPISDPIPQEPIRSDLGLILTEFAQFPPSAPVPAPTDPRLMRTARINYLGQVPGSTRLFTPDLNGKLYTLPANGGTPSVYLDVAATVGANFFSGRGLGSGFGFVAFHPQFATNGRFYTTHTEALGALGSITPDWTQSGAVIHSVLTEWTATDPAAASFSGTRRTLLRIGFATYIHAIQQIDFNPNATPGSGDYGLLYVAVGDGGRGSSSTVPQQLNVPHGKILRIDPQGTNSANGRYGVPAGNPFTGTSGALGEIYAYGMRDPHRFSWDTGGTQRMFLGHIGEHDIEGVYDLRAGDNLGWSEREGSWVFDRQQPCNLYTLPADDARFGYDYPVAAYDHNAANIPCGDDAGKAIVGGFVYRGNALPALRGKYVFGDIVDGRVFYTNEADMVRGGALAPLYQLRVVTPAGAQTSMATLAGDSRVDLRLGTDRAGELYLLAKANGRIWKVTGTTGVASR
ncbi:PQQ-dependent sugar dehydrogenase [Micromonospora sp. CPCC 205371]|nr:PQQ-dependent sugar dehydrogenase [Micromonospora sp. CPCC 205371]